MSEQTSGQVHDQRHLTFEQSSKAGGTFVTAQLLSDFAALIYRAGRQDVEDVVHQGWTMQWRQEPTLRVQIRTFEPKLYQNAKAVLEALGYEVRDKQDHLVVIL